MSHSQILTSPPDRDSLLNSVIEVAFWTAVWFGIVQLTRITVNVPTSILKEEDKKKKRHKLETFINYCVSLLHAVLWIAISAYSLLRNPWARARAFTDVEMFAIKCSFGYFIMDTILGIKTGVNDMWMNIHHVGILVCYTQSIVLNNSAFELMLAVFIGEFTNPFNCIRTICDYEGRKEESTRQSYFFAVSFLIARGIFSTFVGTFTVLSPKISYVLKVNCCLMLFVSYIWVWKILNQGTKQLMEAFPDNKSIKRAYSSLVAMRKFSNPLYGFFFLASFYWLGESVYYDSTKNWPTKYLR